MFWEFVRYYFYHNEYIALPFLMFYMIIGAFVGILFVISEWVLNSVFGTEDDDSIAYVPNFFRFTTFWLLWFILEAMEFFCERWFSRGYYAASSLNSKLTNWMLMEK